MATKLSITSVQVLCFISCSAAIAFVKAPFDIAFVPAFMDFIAFIGMVLESERSNKANRLSRSFTG